MTLLALFKSHNQGKIFRKNVLLHTKFGYSVRVQLFSSTTNGPRTCCSRKEAVEALEQLPWYCMSFLACGFMSVGQGGAGAAALALHVHAMEVLAQLHLHCSTMFCSLHCGHAGQGGVGAAAIAALG
eukprot:1157588-Pelagomonas_calceolata.AAC.12